MADAIIIVFVIVMKGRHFTQVSRRYRAIKMLDKSVKKKKGDTCEMNRVTKTNA